MLSFLLLVFTMLIGDTRPPFGNGKAPEGPVPHRPSGAEALELNFIVRVFISFIVGVILLSVGYDYLTEIFV